jgi:hypothetical protein
MNSVDANVSYPSESFPTSDFDIRRVEPSNNIYILFIRLFILLIG